MVAAGAARRGPRAAAAGASPTARKALGFEELLAGDVEAMQRNTRRYAQAPAHVDAQAARRALIDLTESRAGGRRGRAARGARARDGMIRAVRFEKWQALGNDYLIVERARRCPFELTPGARPAAVRSALRPRRRRRARARRRPTSPASSRACGSSTRTAPRPSCRATARARRSCTCAARGWTDADTFSIQTAAGEIRPTITGADHLPRRHGPRRADAPRTSPAGPTDGTRRGRGRDWRFQHVSIGNPQCAIRVAGPRRRSRRSTCGDRPGDRARAAVPEPHELVVLVASSRPARSAPGSSSAAWGRRCRRAPARRGAAVAHVLRGGDSPVDGRSSTAAS